MDGIDLLDVIRKHTRSYVEVYYPDTKAVRADTALERFWKQARIRGSLSGVVCRLGVPDAWLCNGLCASVETS